MRVVMLVDTTGLDYDDRVRKEALSLRTLGADVHIVAAEIANRPGQRRVYENRVEATLLHLRARAWFPHRRLTGVALAEIGPAFLRHLVRLRPDVVWLHNLKPGVLIPALALLRRAGLLRRLVWDQHELPPDRLLRQPAFMRFFCALANRCQHLVMANPQRRALALETVGARLRTPIGVLENFPDAEFARQPQKELPADVQQWLGNDDYLLAQGGANPGRNTAALIAAAIATDARLIIAGPYEPQQMDAWRQQHGSRLDSHVLCTGFVPQTDLPRFIDHAAASVVLYDMDSANRRLCAPNRLYQAIARGTPLIVGANPPMAAWVRRLGCGVVLQGDGRDPADIAAGIRALRHGQAAFRQQATAHRFDTLWEAQTETLARIAGLSPPQA